MKEIYEINEKILARGLGVSLMQEINFSRDDIDDADIGLPEDIMEEIGSLQKAINACLPDDFDYYSHLGNKDEAPGFELVFDETPIGDPNDEPFDPEQSLIPQLKKLDWEALRVQGEEESGNLDLMADILQLMEKPLPPTKQIQKGLRDEMKDFIREKRGDAASIHILYVDGDKLMTATLTHGDALRKMLPGLLIQNGNLVTVIVGGKPLPADRIDVLNAEAQKQIPAYIEETNILGGSDDTSSDELSAGDDVIDIESSVIEENQPPKTESEHSGGD